MVSPIYYTYKNDVMPHGHHIHKTEVGMTIAKMWDLSFDKYARPHCKCVLHCCSKYLSFFPPSQKLVINIQNMCPTIRFRVYNVVSCCIVYGKLHFEEKSTCVLCYTVPTEEPSTKFYSRKELMLMETSIYKFLKKVYIP